MIALDENRVLYDLAMLYTQEVLRRMDGDQLYNFANTAPEVKVTFELVYEALSGSIPEYDEM